MHPKEAFELICGALRQRSDKRLVNADYYDHMFGNFTIDIEDESRPRSIVNDRFELVVCEAFGGEGQTRTIFANLRLADEHAVMRSLDL